MSLQIHQCLIFLQVLDCEACRNNCELGEAEEDCRGLADAISGKAGGFYEKASSTGDPGKQRRRVEATVEAQLTQ
jgi:hypothetical protein